MGGDGWRYVFVSCRLTLAVCARLCSIGEEEVELHPNFKLFLHTKLSNPHFPPEVQAETTLINFAVTEAGLEEQLLSVVVKKEMYELAMQRDQLILQQNQFKIEIKRLEDQILAKLAAAEGDVTQARSVWGLLSVCV